MAQLSASLPPEVKKISSFLAPRALATFSRASSSKALASLPKPCTLEGFMGAPARTGPMASTTSGSSPQVAALSK